MNTDDLPTTLQEAIGYFSDSSRCLEFMKALRWPDGVIRCPDCASDNLLWMSNAARWKCRACKGQFSIKRGTIFEDSPLGLEKWIPALWVIVNAKNGVSSCELHRALGVTQKTAWFMLHRIRLALQGDGLMRLNGVVEADETFIGGSARKMNAIQKAKRKAGLNGAEGWFTRQVINHAECYARGHVHVNGMENFWSLLKRCLRGTYVSVEPFHLFRYLDEQAFRFNERKDKLGDLGRFLTAMAGVIGKRLTYKRLIGQDEDCPPACA